MDIELRHHRHAVALEEHRNFQRAARALGISQPALSRSILELERRVGATLFSRTSSGAEATDAGRVFLAKARGLIAQADDLAREMRLIRGLESGELRFGAGVYPSEMFVAGAMARMSRAHPSLKLTAVSNGIDTLLQMLRRREIEFVIGDLRTAELERGLRTTPLSWHKGHLVVRAGHPLLAGARFGLREALRHPLALTTRIPPDLLSNFLRGVEAGEDPAATLPAITCDSPSMMKRIVAESDAIGLMPMCLVARELADGVLVALPIDAPWLGRTFAIIELEDRALSPSARQFLEYLRAADGEAAAVTGDGGLRIPRARAARSRRAPAPP
jgi:DNA-binding transcriptional LysR family regulator